MTTGLIPGEQPPDPWPTGGPPQQRHEPVGQAALHVDNRPRSSVITARAAASFEPVGRSVATRPSLRPRHPAGLGLRRHRRRRRRPHQRTGHQRRGARGHLRRRPVPAQRRRRTDRGGRPLPGARDPAPGPRPSTWATPTARAAAACCCARRWPTAGAWSTRPPTNTSGSSSTSPSALWAPARPARRCPPRSSRSPTAASASPSSRSTARGAITRLERGRRGTLRLRRRTRHRQASHRPRRLAAHPRHRHRHRRGPPTLPLGGQLRHPWRRRPRHPRLRLPPAGPRHRRRAVHRLSARPGPRASRPADPVAHARLRHGHVLRRPEHRPLRGVHRLPRPRRPRRPPAAHGGARPRHARRRRRLPAAGHRRRDGAGGPRLHRPALRPPALRPRPRGGRAPAATARARMPAVHEDLTAVPGAVPLLRRHRHALGRHRAPEGRGPPHRLPRRRRRGAGQILERGGPAPPVRRRPHRAGRGVAPASASWNACAAAPCPSSSRPPTCSPAPWTATRPSP